jgi:hypothetical protein
MKRIATHAQGVVADLRKWVDLRIDLAVIDLEDKLDERLNAVAVGIIIAVFGGLAAFFTLVTIALGLGWLLGHPFWGFLIVTAGLGATAAIVRSTQPTLVRTQLYRQWKKARAEAEAQAPSAPPDADPEGAPPSEPQSNGATETDTASSKAIS